ncbi:uncharacterized protein LOC119458984 [Dermacentor silvarum]|uniref:uncharacterized protein LOC119458984 n=1 Tax=Dermacentor silvarum TaxID=543639 RepID=UPI002100C295|nr:uncharacterized protein LOC119458984 [Dermacentor silvarum]
MATKIIFSVVILAVLLASVVSAEEEVFDFKNFDIAKFLHTSKVVWVYNTTEPGTVRCRMDNHTKVEKNSTIFSRQFVNNSKKTINERLGKFFIYNSERPPNDSKYNAMTIYETTGKEEYGEEILEFQSSDSTCAVVFVLDYTSIGESAVWYDLRMSDYTIHSEPPEDCAKRFDYILRQTKKQSWRQIYGADCRNMHTTSS